MDIKVNYNVERTHLLSWNDADACSSEEDCSLPVFTLKSILKLTK